MTKKDTEEGISKRSKNHLREIKKVRRSGNGGMVIPVKTDYLRRMGCTPGDEVFITLRGTKHLHIVKNKKTEVLK
jgi:antitoxin component of MazEF toxin-antitoxin module